MEEKKKRTPRQIAALLCVILLVCMYLVTLVVACLNVPNWDRLFAACIIASVGLPILLWIYIRLYGRLKEKRPNKP